MTRDPLPDLIRAPLDAIDPGALPRDRTGLDPEPLAELEASIAATGLRQPIELFPLAEPEADGPRYGLLTGYRRFTAVSALHARTGDPRFAAIPAFLRPAGDLAASLAAMVEENEIRANLSPFERGLVPVRARELGLFASIEEAVAALHPHAPAYKRSRLRTLAEFAEAVDGYLTAPERLSQAQCLRIARAISCGFGELLRVALEESRLTDAAHQWALIEPILMESEENERRPEPSSRPGRPRRILRPRGGLTIRRERTREGWSLHFTGRQATGMMMDTVLDEIERMYAPG
jgi:ParB family chromosome partitioning protein